jgi:hypothetical protein
MRGERRKRGSSKSGLFDWGKEKVYVHTCGTANCLVSDDGKGVKKSTVVTQANEK